MILIERLTPKKRLLGFDTEGNLVARECSKCASYLPICEFSKHRGLNLGFNTSCKSCKPSKEERKKHNVSRYKKRQENREEYLQDRRDYRLRNRDRLNEKERKHWELNKEKFKVKCKKWKKVNAHICIEYVYIRNVTKKRTLNTLSPEQKSKVRELYKQCRKLNDAKDGTIYSVDHIIPLISKDVCGLHVPENLRILTKTDNSRKGNKFDGTYENESWRKIYE